MIFVNDIYRTGRHETIDRAYAMAIGSTMQEYFEHFGPLHGVEGATVRVQNQNDADLQKLPGASGATDNAESAVSPRLDDGEGGEYLSLVEIRLFTQYLLYQAHVIRIQRLYFRHPSIWRKCKVSWHTGS